MRPLKFRVWDKDDVEYVDGVGDLYLDIVEVGTKVFCIQQICPGRYVIEQFTGLKDKNGKEVYEGDIVKYLSYRKEYVGQVVFDFVDDSEGYYIEKHYGWGIYRDGYNTSLGDYADDNMMCELEIIGNIHENPELLGEGEE